MADASTDASTLDLHPDRLLPPDPHTREIARRLYTCVRHSPIVSPHGHVDPRILLDDTPFTDPATLFVTPDHYVTRLLHASGVGLEELGVGLGELTPEQSRTAWRALCTHWPAFRGTPTRYWLESELSEIFGVTQRPSAASADAIYDRIADALSTPEFRPRALFERFGISVLATTDDPVDDLSVHEALAADPAFTGRVIPTFRPDRHLEAGHPNWAAAMDGLAQASGTDTGTYAGWVAAMENRRAYFQAHGATSADHSHLDVGSEPLPAADADRIYRQALRRAAAPADTDALRRHMLLEMARMSCDDGLVMTLHPGVVRNHHRPTFERFGADTGHDIPRHTDFTEPLRPLLERFGTYPGFHLVLFTVDETAFSREIAPLAGFYPAVHVGAPWWFLDAPDAVRRFRSAVTETAGLTKTSGFIDDTRAFCSIPARHDMARRLDSGYLAGLVAEHRLDEDEARDALTDLVTTRPVEVFKL